MLLLLVLLMSSHEETDQRQAVVYDTELTSYTRINDFQRTCKYYGFSLGKDISEKS